MKPYFAKYLPVEGEMKKGVVVRKKLSGLTGVCMRDISSDEKDEYEKVQLFLYSRDINVGDKVKYNTSGTEDEVLEVYNDVAISLKRTKGAFLKQHVSKVIGPISPNAIWVKEGDEFDEDEWRAFNSKIEIIIAKGVTMLFGHVSQFDPWYIQVKGPCGHFH